MSSIYIFAFHLMKVFLSSQEKYNLNLDTYTIDKKRFILLLVTNCIYA